MTMKERVRSARAIKAMNMAQFADICGVSSMTISRIERGKTDNIRSATYQKVITKVKEIEKEYGTHDPVPSLSQTPKPMIEVKEQSPAADVVTMDALVRLATGQTFNDLQGILGQLKQVKDSATATVERLLNTDKSIVRNELEMMLAKGKQKELPMLEEIITGLNPVHSQSPLLMAAVRCGIPVWLYGEAGSGKTTSAEKIAEALGLQFGFISVCPVSTKSDFLGYNDATGHYNSTSFRIIFEEGGVFLIDEIDNGNPAILAVLNTALANGQCAFPDGIVSRHKSTVLVAAANTIGKGANTEYVGRNAIDAATLDRFVFVNMDIDENLEDVFIGKKWKAKPVDISEGGMVEPNEWLDIVRSARKACQRLTLRHIVSPRATIYGSRLIRAGVGKKHLMDMCIYKGLKAADREKLDATMASGR